MRGARSRTTARISLYAEGDCTYYEVAAPAWELRPVLSQSVLPAVLWSANVQVGVESRVFQVCFCTCLLEPSDRFVVQSRAACVLCVSDRIVVCTGLRGGWEGYMDRIL